MPSSIFQSILVVHQYGGARDIKRDTIQKSHILIHLITAGEKLIKSLVKVKRIMKQIQRSFSLCFATEVLFILVTEFDCISCKVIKEKRSGYFTSSSIFFCFTIIRCFRNITAAPLKPPLNLILQFSAAQQQRNLREIINSNFFYASYL